MLFCVGLVLRLLLLGNTFQSADNAALAEKILRFGYRWMIADNYGFLINIYVKLFTAGISALGIDVTEFWWKAPIALAGSLQVPLTYLFLKKLKCHPTGAVLGAAIMAVLPIHVMQSRYPWGYEVLGVLFITLAIWALLDFYERPTVKRGLVASLMLGFYLISHGYIVPFAPCLAAMVILFGRSREQNGFRAFLRGPRLFFQKYVWVGLVLFFPIYFASLRYTFSKKSELGFYLPSHLLGFFENIGLFLAGAMLAAMLVTLLHKEARRQQAWLFMLCGCVYLAPLFFGSPPHVTVERGYMLMGTYFFVIQLCVVFDTVVRQKRRLLYTLAAISLAATCWGTMSSLFGRDQWPDPSLVTTERGDVPPDPGSKAAGYLLRKHLPETAKVLAMHRAIERPVLYYYFGKLDYAFNDLSNNELYEKFLELRDSVDVVITGVENRPKMEADSLFQQKIVISSEETPRMWIYARPGIPLPDLNSDVSAFNEAFDEEFPNRVSLRLGYYLSRILGTNDSEKMHHELQQLQTQN